MNILVTIFLKVTFEIGDNLLAYAQILRVQNVEMSCFTKCQNITRSSLVSFIVVM